MGKQKKIKIYIAVFTAIPAIVLVAFTLVSTAKSFSNDDFKSAASVFLQGAETAGNPITLRIDNNYYYYVPFEVNNTLSTQFPGIMLDKSAKAITDKALLKNLFLYPSLIKEFSSSIKDFDKLAVSKTTAFAKYCRILEAQSIKFSELNMQGNVAGILYHGTKLAFDAVGLVKSSTSGMAKLIKDLAKDKVKDSIISYLTKTDSRAILTSTQKADDSARNANNACKSAMMAWNALQSTTGKASQAYAKAAVEQTYNMFYYEHMTMDALKTGLNKINNYPKLVTKINKKDFEKGMDDLSKFISKLDNEKKYWNDALNNVTDENMLGLWTEEHVSRVSEVSRTRNQPVTQMALSCTDVNLASDYSLYNYTPDSGPCTIGYQEDISGTNINLKCKSAASKWREHWVKEVDVSGLNKLRITADLGLNDRSRFFTECSGTGVKYDNYADLVVLSEDPNPTLRSECNKITPQSEWSKCSIQNTGNNVLGHCGVPKCSASASCDFTVDVTGKNKVYLNFQIHDAWLADIEGTLSNLKICPAK